MSYGRPQNLRNLSQVDIDAARINNQVILDGTNPQFLPADAGITNGSIVFFLEFVDSGSVVVKDAAANALTGTITAGLSLGRAPMRIDGGVILTGTILFAQGFFVIVN